MKTIQLIIKSVRIKQWIKNFFVFAPVIFGGRLFNLLDVRNSTLAFMIFCLASGGIYLLNDVKDKKNDSFHPQKKNRPVASGLLDEKTALLASAVFILASLLFSAVVELSLFYVVLLYIGIHILYTFIAKREMLFDVILIALGFELRIWGGAVVTKVMPSIWLQLCVFVLALFLALIKRGSEKISLYEEAPKHRDVLSRYKFYFLDQLIMICAVLCIVFYGLYSISPGVVEKIGSINMACTVPFVIYGIFRYLQVAYMKKAGGDPAEVLLSDFPLMLTILLWILTAIFLIYNPF